MLQFSSPNLPPGAVLNPNTGAFEWTPAFDLDGEFEILFRVTDGKDLAETVVRLTIINANAAPELPVLAGLNVLEGEQMDFSVFAFDPDNPNFVPQPPLGADPTLPGGSTASVSYRLPVCRRCDLDSIR